MTATLPPSFAASGGGDGNNDQNKNSKLSNTQGIDDDSTTLDDEKVAAAAVAPAVDPIVRLSAWQLRYPHLPFKCSLCCKHFRSSRALKCHMTKALNSIRHSKRERKSSTTVRPREFSSMQAFSTGHPTSHKKQLADYSKGNTSSGTSSSALQALNAATDQSATPSGEELFKDMECSNQSGGGRSLRRTKMMFDLNLPSPLEPTNSEVHDNADNQ